MTCVKMLEEKYSFYAAFENSHCRDYVTEKLFNNLGQYYVPIVYGASDYKKIVPRNSLIDAADFKTVKELGQFLTDVTKLPHLYNQYFWWHKYYKVTSNDYEESYSFCNLCIKLHESHAQYWTKYRRNIDEYVPNYFKYFRNKAKLCFYL
jgi:hypothetical protein